MKRINSLIIGLGQIGQTYDKYFKNKYYTHAKSLFDCNFFKLVGASDISKTKRDFFSKNFHQKAYKNYKIAMKELKPKLVVLATPTQHHYEGVKEIVKNNSVKYLICEKPLSYDLSEAKKILNLCKKKNVKLFVNYFRLSDPYIIKLKKKFSNQKKFLCKVNFCRGYFNNGSHFFNLFEYIFGKFINGKIIGKVKRYKKNDFRCDFYAKFQKADITFKYKNNKSNECSFTLKNNKNLIYYKKNGEQIIEINKTIKNSFMDKYQLTFYNEVFKNISKKKSYLCSGQQAFRTLKNMKKILYHANI